MGQVLGGMWDSARGKRQMKRISEKVFLEFADQSNRLPIDNIYIAVLMLYIYANKQFFSPYKEPPTKKIIDSKVEKFRSSGTISINQEEFFALIMELMKDDLRYILATRIILSLLASPAMSILTKQAAKRVPKINDNISKVPTPLIASIFAIGLVFLQDVTVK